MTYGFTSRQRLIALTPVTPALRCCFSFHASLENLGEGRLCVFLIPRKDFGLKLVSEDGVKSMGTRAPAAHNKRIHQIIDKRRPGSSVFISAFRASDVAGCFRCKDLGEMVRYVVNVLLSSLKSPTSSRVDDMVLGGIERKSWTIRSSKNLVNP